MQTEEYHTILLAERAHEVLFRGENVTIPMRITPVSEPVNVKLRKSEREADSGVTEEGDEKLVQVLKTVRLRLAEEEEIPRYMVFTNASLSDMARRRPHTMEEFLAVSGVGAVKAKKYGEAFLKAIVDYETETSMA